MLIACWPSTHYTHICLSSRGLGKEEQKFKVILGIGVQPGLHVSKTKQQQKRDRLVFTVLGGMNNREIIDWDLGYLGVLFNYFLLSLKLLLV